MIERVFCQDLHAAQVSRVEKRPVRKESSCTACSYSTASSAYLLHEVVNQLDPVVSRKPSGVHQQVSLGAARKYECSIC